MIALKTQREHTHSAHFVFHHNRNDASRTGCPILYATDYFVKRNRYLVEHVTVFWNQSLAELCRFPYTGFSTKHLIEIFVSNDGKCLPEYATAHPRR
jgi:hypothetical protein